MAVGDMPTFAASAYGHGSSVFALDDLKAEVISGDMRANTPSCGDGAFEAMIRRQNAKLVEDRIMAGIAPGIGRRYVQVIISDPHPLVPLDKCILYQGDPMATDLTDQELFFELNLKEKLDEHNKMRLSIVDKTIKDRTEYLEPAKIRDLKMTVVKIADL